jgi:putative transposase
VYRTQKYRLYPTPEQAEKLGKFASGVRFVYNLALEQRRDFWRQYRRVTGDRLDYVTQGRQLTELRREFAWIAETPADFQSAALRELDHAFRAYFRGGGFPRFKKAGRAESFEVKARDTRRMKYNAKWSAISLPKLGMVKFRDTRLINGDICGVRVTLDGGDWYVCLKIRNSYEAPASGLPATGIDRGVRIAMMLSDGTAHNAPSSLAALEANLRHARRVLSSRDRASVRRKWQLAKVGRAASRLARARRDWQHKATTAITRDHGIVVIEALETRNMTAGGRHKRGLNRSILNVGWQTIERMLAYKLEDRGGTLIKTNPAYTSQTCSACGTIDKRSRESQARFACLHCDHEMNADHNAAINILRQGLAGVDGGGYAPDEARTIHLRLAA